MANTRPARTRSPASTLTAVTVPAAPKDRSSVWADARVPSADTVWAIEPMLASAVVSTGVLVSADVLSDRNESQAPTPIRPTSGITTQGRRMADLMSMRTPQPSTRSDAPAGG